MSNSQIAAITISQPKNGKQKIKVPAKNGVIHEFETTEKNVDEFLTKRKRLGRSAALLTGLWDVGAISASLVWINGLKEKWLFKRMGTIGRGITGALIGTAIALIGSPIIEKVAQFRISRHADRFIKQCQKENLNISPNNKP